MALMTVDEYVSRYQCLFEGYQFNRDFVPPIVDVYNTLERLKGVDYAEQIVGSLNEWLLSNYNFSDRECFCKALEKEKCSLLPMGMFDKNSDDFQMELQKLVRVLEFCDQDKSWESVIVLELLKNDGFLLLLVEGINEAISLETKGDGQGYRKKIAKDILGSHRWVLDICPETYRAEAIGLLSLLFLICSPEMKSKMFEKGCLLNESFLLKEILKEVFSPEELIRFGNKLNYWHRKWETIVLGETVLLHGKDVRRSFNRRTVKWPVTFRTLDYLSPEFYSQVDSFVKKKVVMIADQDLYDNNREGGVTICERDNYQEKMTALCDLQRASFQKNGSVKMVLEGSQALRANLILMYSKDQPENCWIEPRDWDFLVKREDFNDVLVELGVEDEIAIQILLGLNIENENRRITIESENMGFEYRGANKSSPPKSLRYIKCFKQGIPPLMVDFVFVDSLPDAKPVNFAMVGIFPVVSINHSICSAHKMVAGNYLAVDKLPGKYKPWLYLDHKHGHKKLSQHELKDLATLVSKIGVLDLCCDQVRQKSDSSLLVESSEPEKSTGLVIPDKQVLAEEQTEKCWTPRECYSACLLLGDKCNEEQWLEYMRLANVFLEATEVGTDEDLSCVLLLLRGLLNKVGERRERPPVLQAFFENILHVFGFDRVFRSKGWRQLYCLLQAHVGEECLDYQGLPLLFLLKGYLSDLVNLGKLNTDDMDVIRSCFDEGDRIKVFFKYSDHFHKCSKCCKKKRQDELNRCFLDILKNTSFLKKQLELLMVKIKLEPKEEKAKAERWKTAVLASEWLETKEKLDYSRRKIEKIKDRVKNERKKKEGVAKLEKYRSEVIGYEEKIKERSKKGIEKKTGKQSSLDGFLYRVIAEVDHLTSIDAMNNHEAIKIVDKNKKLLTSLPYSIKLGITHEQAEAILGLLTADVLYKHSRVFYHVTFLEDILKTDNLCAAFAMNMEKLKEVTCDDMRFFYRLRSSLIEAFLRIEYGEKQVGLVGVSLYLYHKYLVSYPADELNRICKLLDVEGYFDLVYKQYSWIRKFKMWHDIVFPDVVQNVTYYQERNDRFKASMSREEKRKLHRYSKTSGGDRGADKQVGFCLQKVHSDGFSDEEKKLFDSLDAMLEHQKLMVYRNAGLRNCMIEGVEIATVLNRECCEYYGNAGLLSEMKVKKSSLLAKDDSVHDHHVLCQNHLVMNFDELEECSRFINTSIGIHYFEYGNYQYKEIKAPDTETQVVLHLGVVEYNGDKFVVLLTKKP